MIGGMPPDAARFEPAYLAGPPWEIGRPQPAIVDLADAGIRRGPILDVGCGTGENALELSRRGHVVVGVDSSPTAISRARAKARERGLRARFVIGDAYQLSSLGERFATVIDSALLHIIFDRGRYAAELAAVLEPGGLLVLLEISERVTGRYPRISREEIRAAFTPPYWRIDGISPTGYQVVDGVVPGWLGLLTRLAERREQHRGSVPP